MTEPLTPAESDLQDFPFMPLHVARLRDSDLAAEESAEALGYAVLLWCASWHQLPAGSLPDNEAVLTRLVNLGKDVRTFRKVREAAMRGFILCSDGRWYHPVVAEQVNSAWAEKVAYRERKEKRTAIAEKAAAARWASDKQSGGDAGVDAPTMHEASKDDASCIVDAMLKGTGTGTGTGTGNKLEEDDARESAKPESVEEMARLIGNAAGINHNPASDHTRFADNLAHVRDWVQLGATIDLMTECAQRACAAQSEPIRSFRYLDGPIRQAVAKKQGAAGKPKEAKVKPLASGGSLFQKLQAGEITREEFDREQAKLLAAERDPVRRGRPVQATIGDIASRVAGGRA